MRGKRNGLEADEVKRGRQKEGFPFITETTLSEVQDVPKFVTNVLIINKTDFLNKI